MEDYYNGMITNLIEYVYRYNLRPFRLSFYEDGFIIGWSINDKDILISYNGDDFIIAQYINHRNINSNVFYHLDDVYLQLQNIINRIKPRMLY